ncbi:MAG: T9SS type A sorting domain-containing protein [Saprospiraceae bacterium]
MKKSIFAITLTLLSIASLFAQTSIHQNNTNQSIDLDSAPPAVQAGVAKALNQAIQQTDEVHLSNPNFKSHFTKNAVSLSPHGNHLEWQWQLQTINGQVPLSVTPTLREAYNKEFVDYQRGNITERYVFHHGSIEQRFIVNEMPASRQLRIEGDILTEGIFQQENDHWFWANEKSSVQLGQLYVYDATGATIPADFEVCADYTAITIEEDALAAATFPVTIDPEIGPDDFRISTMGNDGNADFGANTPTIAYNSTDDNYLVVWQGDEAIGSLVNDEFEIYGQIINSDGSFFLQRFRISFQGSDGNGNLDAANPSVAYNSVSNNYLVVWQGDDNVGGLVNDEFEIYGQLVGNIGNFTGANFRISDMSTDGNADFDANNPEVAYNPAADNYLVVWQGDDEVNDQLEIYGQRIAATGAEIGVDFQISNQGISGNTNFDAVNAAVAYNSEEDNYLVIWQGDSNDGQLVDNECEVYGQLLTAIGTEIGGDFRISDMGDDGADSRDAQQADVAYNSIENNYLVVWFGDDITDANFEVYGQLLASDGTEIGVNDFQISEIISDSAPQRDPKVAYSDKDNKYLVVWTARENRDGETRDEAWGQYIDAAGHQIAPNDFRISDATNGGGVDVLSAYVAYNSTNGNFLSVWSSQETFLGNAEYEIFGQLLNLEAPTDQFRISAQGTEGNTNFQVRSPDVAFNTIDSNYLVVWEGETVSSNDGKFEILGQLISDEGFLLDFPIQISDVGGSSDAFRDGRDPAVVYNPMDNNYLVVWSADDPESNVDDEFEIFGQFLNARGNEIGTNDFRISEMGPENSSDFDAFAPRLALNTTANNYMVVWQGDDDLATSDGEFEIFGQLITTAGERTFNNDIRISDMGPDQDGDFDAFEVAISYNPTDNEYLVVWSGEDNSGNLVEDEFEIYGQRLDALGNEIGTNDFRISQQGFDGNPNFEAEEPAVAYNPTANNYLVTWNGDFNSGAGLGGQNEIFGQLIDNDGTEIGADFRISNSGVDGDPEVDAINPAITYDNLNNTFLVTWESNGASTTVDIGGTEIFGQFISPTGVELGENDFRISQMGPDGNDNFDSERPALAFNPINNNFLVIWVGDDDVESVDDEFEIFGELISDQIGDDCPEDLTDTELGNLIFSGLYEAANTITSAGRVLASLDSVSGGGVTVVEFVAGESITLNAGFQVQAGATFSATIGTLSCFVAQELTNDDVEYRTELPATETPPVIEKITLVAQPNPFHSETQLRFQLPEQQQVSLQLFDQMGRLVQTIVPQQRRAAGEYVFSLRNEQGLRGLYFVVLQTESEQVVQKIMVLNN